MAKTIVVVAAHADDEAIGCGGTIARHVAEGDTVHAIFIADGVTSRGGQSSNELDKRQASAIAAQSILGIKSTSFLNLPDNRLDSVSLLDIIQPLEAVIKKLTPEVIYTHHYGDLNVDHRITHQAVMTACRPLPGSSVREIYTFEIMSSTEWATPTASPFVANYYVDISKYLSRKLDALEAYKDEMRQPPHSRSIEHIKILALHRGHTVGVAAAEAFMVVRVVQ